MAEPPFTATDQLDSSLNIILDATTYQPRLCHTDPRKFSLPSQPRVPLSLSKIRSFVKADLLTPDLNQLTPYLWLVSTPRSSHISALHHQAVRGRKIVLAENPQLHLVWRNDVIFIKPLPPYLLSHAFWVYVFDATIGNRTTSAAVTEESVHACREGWEAASGLLRTYSHLVKYETDFRIGKDLRLIPDHVEWEAFAQFIDSFHSLRDDEVSPRYRYGELRLTRLNFYTRIFLFPKLTFHHIDAQWGTFFGKMFPLLLFLFAVMTVILGAMQVELAVQQVSGTDVGASWLAYQSFCRWLSVTILLVTACIIVFQGVLIVFFFVHDIIFARSVLSYEAKHKLRNSVFEYNKRSGVV